MNSTNCGTGISSNPSGLDEAAHEAETLEESVLRECDEARKNLNARETAINRLPLAIRRMTRQQARAVGLWF